jgi:hypothetical protein
MVLEKKLVNVNSSDHTIEDSVEIKIKLDKALEEQKKVRRMINLFILALFLVFTMFMLS